MGVAGPDVQVLGVEFRRMHTRTHVNIYALVGVCVLCFEVLTRCGCVLRLRRPKGRAVKPHNDDMCID